MTTTQKISIAFRRWTLSSLNRVISFLLGPFVRAESVASYANNGYGLLGLFSLLIYLYFLGAGYLSYPMTRAAPIIQLTYQLAADRLGLKFIPDSMASLAALPFLLYLAIFIYRPARIWFGEKFANLLFWSADQAIVAGEWCIEHRWQSLMLIMFLVAILTFGVARRFEQASHERVLRRDFDDWLAHAEDFVDQNPIAKPEYEKYDHVRLFWRTGFDALSQAPGGYRHRAIYLNKMLEILYRQRTDETWVEVLRDSIRELESCMKECEQAARPTRDQSEARAWALMNTVMGRIYVRLEENNNDYSALSKALERFSAIDSPAHKSSAINGKGTVYAHAFTAYLDSSNPTQSDLAILRTICPNSYQCAVEALKSYQEAATGNPTCSFPAKRRDNNVIDLLSRIGMHYDEVVKQANTPPIDDWVSSPSALARTIRGKIGELMACNDSDPVLSSFFVTAAQGFSSSARLRMLAGENPTSDVESAGAYLRLASSFEPKSTSIWELSYFCPILHNEAAKTSFINSLSRSFDGLPNGERLFRRIELSCR